ncbi:MAG: FISUMP domain-containing protein [Bacteroidota bacterium]
MKPLFYFIIPLLVATTFTSCRKDPRPVPQPLPDNGSLTKITIDNKLYPVVKIGSKYWLAANFNGQGGVDYSGTIPRPEYGKYYSVTEMRAFTLPAGWRIPTETDYRDLLTVNGIDINAQVTADTKKITSVTLWNYVNGTNTSGFNAMPAGYVFNNGKAIDGDIAEFWVSDGKTFSIMESGNRNALKIQFYADSDNPNAGYRFNVRFVREV